MNSNNEDTQLKTEAISGVVISAKPSPKTDAELEQRRIGFEEGLERGVIVTLEKVVPPLINAVIENVSNEALKKSAISSGLRYGSPECGKAMNLYQNNTGRLQ